MLFVKSSFVLLAAMASVVFAAPATHKRQNTCPLQQLGGLSIVASADPTGKTRWDLFTISAGLIQQGDVAWFTIDQPNDNEVFTANVGNQPNLFTFQRREAQSIGVSGSKLLASDTPATFKVNCAACDSFAQGNDLAGNGCTFELTDGSNGIGQCITFEGSGTVVQLQQCETGNPGQTFGIFSA